MERPTRVPPAAPVKPGNISPPVSPAVKSTSEHTAPTPAPPPVPPVPPPAPPVPLHQGSTRRVLPQPGQSYRKESDDKKLSMYDNVTSDEEEEEEDGNEPMSVSPPRYAK